MNEAKVDVATAKAAIALADGGEPLPDGAPCCGWCGGIKMDCTLPPETPAAVLRRGSGCPLSIVAYQIKAHRVKGDDIDVIAQPQGTPYLRINGKPVDPLEHYGQESCGCK